MVELRIVEIEKDADAQVIIGHAGFIKTAEDLYEAMMGSAPGVKFGVAFVEASGPCLVRSEGNDPALKSAAERNALAMGAGHSFVILFKSAYPINVNNAIKAVPEVVSLHCATANPVQLVIAETGKGRSILGVVDGSAAKGLESEDDRAKRKKFLREIGYKL